MLAYYAEHLLSTEINNSFYHLPEKGSLKRWDEATPDDFLLSAKASRYITHMKKLKDLEQGLNTFLQRMQILGAKLGPILFQLPPHWRSNKVRLERFLAALSKEFRYAFEFRDPSWLNADVYELLAKHGAAFCIYEFDHFISPKAVTTDLVYIRLHGPEGAYQGSYSHRSLSNWASEIAAWAAEGRTVYCYFDNDERGYAVQNALLLQGVI
jgi:uncharacterized protein YecE (DUF72 family)